MQCLLVIRRTSSDPQWEDIASRPLLLGINNIARFSRGGRWVVRDKVNHCRCHREIPFLDGWDSSLTQSLFPGCGPPRIPVLSFMVPQLQTGSWSTGHTKGLFPHSACIWFLNLFFAFLLTDYFCFWEFLIWKRERERNIFGLHEIERPWLCI